MRLVKLNTGHRLLEKLLLMTYRVIKGRSPPDVMRTVLYRRDFWGDPYSEIAQLVLRGPSEWTVGERELFGAFVSKQVHCSY